MFSTLILSEVDIFRYMHANLITGFPVTGVNITNYRGEGGGTKGRTQFVP